MKTRLSFILIIILLSIYVCTIAGSEVVTNSPKKEYRIISTVENPGILLSARQVGKIKYLSPSGKIISTKTFDNNKDCGIVVSPNFKYLIKANATPGTLTDDGRIGPNAPKVTFTYINAKGQSKWSKTVNVLWPMSKKELDDLFQPYFMVISKNGASIVFARGLTEYYYEDLGSDIFVYDTMGVQVASYSNVPLMENDNNMKIASDGKLIVADVFPSGVKKWGGSASLLILDAETGRMKVVKSEERISRKECKWSLGGFPLENKIIEFSGSSPLKNPWSIEMHFDKIPDDLSILFENGNKP